jgi:hypothetical protein
VIAIADTVLMAEIGIVEIGIVEIVETVIIEIVIEVDKPRS